MGLDMYLYLRKYESCASWREGYATKRENFYPKELESFANKIDNRNFMSKQMIYQIGYWRKANYIHKWIIRHCANGVDECQEIYIPSNALKVLLSHINAVLKDHSLAEKLLPTSEGFFFGSQEYDEWYFEELKYTKELLEEVITFIKTNTDYQVFYKASW